MICTVRDLMEFCGKHDVRVSISPAREYGLACYQIQMDRGEHHAKTVIDIEENLGYLPKDLDYILEHHLFLIKKRERGE